MTQVVQLQKNIEALNETKLASKSGVATVRHQFRIWLSWVFFGLAMAILGGLMVVLVPNQMVMAAFFLLLGGLYAFAGIIQLYLTLGS